jgi:hypothetical protein
VYAHAEVSLAQTPNGSRPRVIVGNAIDYPTLNPDGSVSFDMPELLSEAVRGKVRRLFRKLARRGW